MPAPSYLCGFFTEICINVTQPQKASIKSFIIYNMVFLKQVAYSARRGDNATVSCCWASLRSQASSLISGTVTCKAPSLLAVLKYLHKRLPVQCNTHTHTHFLWPHTLLVHSLMPFPPYTLLQKKGPGWIAIWRCRALAADVLTLVNEPSAPPNLSL